MEDFKKRKMNAENEYEFADMLAAYGEKVNRVDAQLAQEKSEMDAALEERLKKRRQRRREEIDEQKTAAEAKLHKDTVE
jgi:hypothetical protein